VLRSNLAFEWTRWQAASFLMSGGRSTWTFGGTHMTRADLLGKLATIILGRTLPHPTRVAIDGVDAAGKTTLANELEAILKSGARRVIRASIDGFHNPKAIRRRDDSAEGYFRCSFNYQALVDNLLAPLGPAGSRLFRCATFDFRTDSEVILAQERATPDAILLFDGVFLLRRELRSHWDLSVFVDADFETTIVRAEVRDCELFGGAAAVRQRYESRYVPGQRLYLEQEQPRNFANIIVFNGDFSAPRMERAVEPGAEPDGQGINLASIGAARRLA
jgi:uridine kinase